MTFIPPLMTLLQPQHPILTDRSLGGGWTTEIGPSAIHLSGMGKTLVAWYSVGAGGNKTTKIAAYDTTAGTWSERAFVGNFLLADDDHGRPSICQDSSGFIYCFYGSHAGTQPWSISTAANDISAWTQQTALSGAQSYPHACFVGSVIYLFVRNDTNLTRRTLAVRTATPSGGSATFSGMTTLVDFGASTRFYMGEARVVGTDIHIVATKADSADTVRQGVYYFVYKTATGAIENHDGSVSTAAGSLPISLATANASYRLFDHGTGDGDTPSFCFDSSGDPHIIFADNGGSGTTFTLKHIKRTSGTWSSPVSVDTIYVQYPSIGYKSVYTAVPGASGKVEFWYVRDSNGNKMRKVRDSGGTIGPAETILAAVGGLTLVNNQSVRDATSGFRTVFSEAVNTLATLADTDVTTLRFFGYGDNGPLRAAIPTATVDPLFANVSLLLGFEHRDTATTIINDAPTSLIPASVAGNAQIDTAQSKFGSASLLLDGTGDFITYANDSRFSVSGGDLCAECWIRRTGASKQQTIFSKRPAAGSSEWVTYILSTNVVRVTVFDNSTFVLNLDGTTTVNANQWYHFEVDRVGTTWYLFLDGNLEATGTQSGAATSNSTAFSIGRDPSNTGRDFNGWIDEVRFTSGAARHTASFTAPSSAFPRR